MNKENHARITKIALEGTALHRNSIDLIAMANQDSDHQSVAASLDEQHFCGGSKKEDQANGSLVIAKCNSFIDEVLEIAAMMTRRSNTEEITSALYFIGRAFHCIQDFYAHSNWIALKRREVWNGQASPPNLKFCVAASNKLDNSAGLYKLALKNLFFKAERRKRVFKRIISRHHTVGHPDMHLDFKDSLGDKVITEGANITGESAYGLTEKLAVKASQMLYISFLMKMMENRYNPTSPVAVAKWKKFKANLGDNNSKYAQHHNDAGCDAIMALKNLNDHNPGQVKRVDIENSRLIFNTYFGLKSKPVISMIVGAVDHMTGKFDSAIF